MKGVRKFYHYSKSISKILRTKFLSDNSFSKTNTYDLVLEVCPEVLLGKKEIAKFRKNRPRKRKSYESKYSHVDLKFKNRLLQEFFSHNRYVLGFDEKLSKGWIKSGMFQLLANRIGNRYFEFGIDEETAKNSFDSKFWGPYMTVKHAVPYINKKGSVTLYSGALGQRPVLGTVISASISCAVEGLARALTVELAPIRVNCIAPGLTQTEFFDKWGKKQTKQFFADRCEMLIMKRPAQPEEIAETAIYLMKNTYTTGTTLYVDGGYALK